MAIKNQSSKILFISTIPPVKCGIASFTNDLVSAIMAANDGNYSIRICALDKEGTAKKYNFPVSMVMDNRQSSSWISTAALINSDPSIDLVCIEHEFGLYGGELGENFLKFAELLQKPFVVRFHTVLPDPSLKRLQIVQAIGEMAEKVLVMTQNSSKILREDYQVSARKITIIPHGTHVVSPISAEELKVKYELRDNLVLTTFGLLSPNKGIENGILAMKEISEQFPQAIYIVLGLTHPNLLQQEGEKYRNYLQQLINDNNLQENVRLVNEYVPIEKLMEYLKLTDIYLFTSKDPYQAVSGTFLYAMSAGCCIISNPFVLAKEMLDEDTGVIIETGKEEELAKNAIRLLENRQLIEYLGRNAFLKTIDTTWKKVAILHKKMFDELLGKIEPPSKRESELIIKELI
jgi:glycosyltransferase involved in cell wall biosynthesis